MIKTTETNKLKQTQFNDSMGQLIAEIGQDGTPQIDYDYAMQELNLFFGGRFNGRLSGLEAVPPEKVNRSEHNNFWAWVCDEYRVSNNMPVWLDLEPSRGPHWVRAVLHLLADMFPQCVAEGEIKLYAHW